MGFNPTFGKEEDAYAHFDTGATGIELLKRKVMAAWVGRSEAPASANAQDTVTLSFEVDDVNESYQQLKGKGIAFVVGPTNRADCGICAAHFRDPTAPCWKLA